jgi:hypothetical protein
MVTKRNFNNFIPSRALSFKNKPSKKFFWAFKPTITTHIKECYLKQTLKFAQQNIYDEHRKYQRSEQILLTSLWNIYCDLFHFRRNEIQFHENLFFVTFLWSDKKIAYASFGEVDSCFF